MWLYLSFGGEFLLVECMIDVCGFVSNWYVMLFNMKVCE